MKLTHKTPGKINLYLKVTKRRDDGYHELDTLFMPVSEITDIITITDAPQLMLSSNKANLPTDNNNICYRAAIEYATMADIAPQWHIHIEKHIPIAAGMGGGSSDAAAVITLLQRHYQLLSSQQVSNLALKLGADVTFFLEPSLSKGWGIGEKLTPISGHYPPLSLLIIHPRFPVSAAWAYRHLATELIGASAPEAIARLLTAWHNADWSTMGSLLHNDLSYALLNKFPILQLLHKRLLDYGACGVEVSGSGPTMFALFNNRQERDKAKKIIEQQYPEIGVF